MRNMEIWALVNVTPKMVTLPKSKSFGNDFFVESKTIISIF